MKNVNIFIYIPSNTVIKPFTVHVEVVYSILIHPQRCMAQEKPHCPVLFHVPKRSTKPYFLAPQVSANQRAALVVNKRHSVGVTRPLIGCSPLSRVHTPAPATCSDTSFTERVGAR